MNEVIVSFETAKLANEKSFGIKTLFAYNLLGVHHHSFKVSKKDFDIFSFCPAPTQSLLQKWLREEHNIIVEVNFNFNNKYSFRIYYYDDAWYCSKLNEFFETYENCLEKALLEALNYIEDERENV